MSYHISSNAHNRDCNTPVYMHTRVYVCIWVVISLLQHSCIYAWPCTCIYINVDLAVVRIDADVCMCVYVYTCVCIYRSVALGCVLISTKAYVCVYVYVYVYMCIYVCVYVYICICVYVYICLLALKRMCVYMCMYMCICVYMYMCIYIYLRVSSGTAYCIWSVASPISKLNRWCSSLYLFCHVPLKRNQLHWERRLIV